MHESFITQNPSALWFLAGLSIFTIAVTILSEAGIGGHAIGMWLMYARTEGVVAERLSSQVIPHKKSTTPSESRFSASSAA